MNILRAKGWIAFIVITVIVTVFTMFFAKRIIIEQIAVQGSKVLGVPMRVANLDISLSPFSLSIFGLHVAHPDRHQHTFLAADTIRVQVDPIKAYLGHVIIESFVIDALRVNIPSSNANQEHTENALDQAVKNAKNALPDVEELLNKPLITDQRLDELDTLINSQKTQWEQIKTALPTASKLKDYENRANAITKKKIKSVDDYQQAKNDLSQLKAEIKQDKHVTQQARRYLSEAKTNLKTQLNAVKNAPEEDWEALKDVYETNKGGLGAATEQIIQPIIEPYIASLMYWYDRFATPSTNQSSSSASEHAENEQVDSKPVVDTINAFVHFKRENPLPSFLLKRAKITIETSIGQLAMLANDVTNEQHITGKPTTTTLQGEKLKDGAAVDVNGIYDNRTGQDNAQLDIRIEGLPMPEQTLQIDNHRIYVKSQGINVIGNAELQRASTVDATADVMLSALRYSQDSEAQPPSWFPMLRSVDELSVKVKAKGHIDEPTITYHSNLDDQLKSVVKQKLTAEQQALKAKFMKKLDQKLQAKLAQSETMQSQLGDEALSLDSNKDTMDGILSSKVDDYKNQAKDKIKDELKDKFKRLF